MFLSITFRPENSGPLIATQSFERISLSLTCPSLLTGRSFFVRFRDRRSDYCAIDHHCVVRDVERRP